MNFITSDDVAFLTGFATARAFLSSRRRLELDASFPPPLPTCKRPLKWRKDAVEAWLEGQGTIADAGRSQITLPTDRAMLIEARTP